MPTDAGSTKLKVMVLFGGRSAEHEVSIQSARNVIAAMDSERYDILPVAIDRDGRWYLLTYPSNDLDRITELGIANTGEEVVLAGPSGRVWSIQSGTELMAIDLAFPVLHGPFGEDGTIQGVLRYSNIPFVGPGILGSALGMDKEAMKFMLKAAGIPVARFITVHKHRKEACHFHQVEKDLGLPVFVKPANMGSSVGVHKVTSATEFNEALEDAFKYDNKILIEEMVHGREIECAVVGNEEPKASVLGEIVPQHSFYSYQAKYVDESGARLIIPADLPATVSDSVRAMALQVFKVLQCEGLSRVDFFLTSDNQPIVNEINTIPGFTKISMYPKLWEASGLKYSALIDELIRLALARFQRDQALN